MLSLAVLQVATDQTRVLVRCSRVQVVVSSISEQTMQCKFLFELCVPWGIIVQYWHTQQRFISRKRCKLQTCCASCTYQGHLNDSGSRSGESQSLPRNQRTNSWKNSQLQSASVPARSLHLPMTSVLSVGVVLHVASWKAPCSMLPRSLFRLGPPQCYAKSSRAPSEPPQAASSESPGQAA